MADASSLQKGWPPSFAPLKDYDVHITVGFIFGLMSHSRFLNILGASDWDSTVKISMCIHPVFIFLPWPPHRLPRTNSKGVRWSLPGRSRKANCGIPVLVAERNALSIELLSGALRRCQAFFDVVGYALSAAEAIKKLPECRPRLVLVSIQLRDGNTAGYRVLSHIRDHHSEIGAVALLEDSSREHVLEAFRSGARGVVSREQPFRLLAKSLRKVYEGGIWASSDQIGFVFETLNRESKAALRMAPRMSPLTPREKEVVAQVVDGLSNAEIGMRLGLSEHTVRNYIMKVYDKLGVSNRVQLTRHCVELQTVSAGS